VLVRTFEEDQKSSGDLVTAGVKEAGLVHLQGRLSHPSPEQQRLLAMVDGPRTGQQYYGAMPG